MKAKYKLLAVVPFIMMTGCKREYSAVVKDVSDNKIWVTDTESNTDKIFVLNTRYDHLNYVYPGDTLEYVLKKHYWHKHKFVVNIPEYGHLCLDKDSLNVRQDRVILNRTKQQLLAKNYTIKR